MSETIDRRAARTCGFTLVEVLVIVAILALMAGIVFPSVDKAMRRQTFIDSAMRVESGLRSARAAAVAGGSRVRFVVTGDGHGFRYADQVDRVPNSVTLGVPARGVLFFPDGSALGGAIDISDGRLATRLWVDDALGTIGRRP